MTFGYFVRITRLPSIGMITKDSQNIDKALKDALDGTAMLFLGAGISELSKNSQGQMLPNGSALALILAEELGKENKAYDLGRISQYFRREKGPRALCELLSGRLVASNIDAKLQEFLGCPWRVIYTTNYDNVIEQSVQHGFSSLSHKSDPTLVGKRIIHLNGRIEDITPSSIDDDIILTDWSYATSGFPTSKWADVFRSDLQLAKSVLFVGYSLADLDIARILIEDELIKSKTIFVVGEGVDEIDVASMEAFGTVYSTGFTYVAARLRQVKKSHVAKESAENFGSLTEFKIDAPTEARPSAAVLFEQFVYGKIDLPSLLGTALAFDQQSFLIERPEALT